MCWCVRRGVSSDPRITTHDKATSPHAAQGAHARSTATPAHTLQTQGILGPVAHGEQEGSAGAQPPLPPPGRTRSTPSLIGRCFLIMQIICVDQAASCPYVIKHRGWGSGSAPGELGREPRERRAGTLPDPSVPPPSAGPAPPLPRPFQPAPPFLRSLHLTLPLCSLPCPLRLSCPPRPPPPVQGGTAGQAGTAGGRTGRGYGCGARRVCAARRPRPKPAPQHRGQRHRHERAKPGSCRAHEGPFTHAFQQILRGLGRAGPQAAVREEFGARMS